MEICERSRDWKGTEFNLPHKTSCVSRLNKLTLAVTDNHMVTRRGVSTPSVLQNLTCIKNYKKRLLFKCFVLLYQAVDSEFPYKLGPRISVWMNLS